MLKLFAKKSSLFLLLIVVVLVFSEGLQASTDSAENAKSFFLSQEKTYLCLNMIVKNESRIIERCLNSVKDHVDCISICDTGSTDNTVEIIEQFLQKNNIPGKVHRHPWKNFGYNRTLSAQAAQTTLKELGFPLYKTYLLLLDADMILEKKPDFSKEELKEDSYLILQINPVLSYYNTRLVRASFPWKSVGVTHEYWTSDILQCMAKLQTLVIDDKEDGGCKSDKLERDVKLLLQGLEEEPNNERYMFYLAQTYKVLERFSEAIRWYKKRIEKGGWVEEVSYSKYMIGEIYEKMDFWDQALHWYLDAYQTNPHLADPLRNIATYYRLKEQFYLAYLFAKQGSKIPYPHDLLLFINHSVYHYQFDEEISIVAYYTDFKEEGYAAADRLALKRDIPPPIKDQTYKNLLIYAENLKNAIFLPIEIPPSFLQEKSRSNQNLLHYPSTHDFSRFKESTTPIKFDEGYLVVVHEAVMTDHENVLHRFVYLDKDFKIHSLSKPFTFRHKGNEFCGEMTIDHSNKNCLLSIGIEDKEAYLVTVNFDTVRGILEPLP